MSDTTRHADRDITPVGEALLWAAWRLCTVPAALVRGIIASGAILAPLVSAWLVTVPHYLNTARAHLARRPDAAYVAVVTAVVLLAVATGIVAHTS